MLIFTTDTALTQSNIPGTYNKTDDGKAKEAATKQPLFFFDFLILLLKINY